MSLTYTLITQADTATGNDGAQAVVAGITPGTTLLAAFMGGQNSQNRNFIPQAQAPASIWGQSGNGTNGGIQASGVAASVVFPVIVSATQVTDPQGNATGGVRLVLKPGTGDTINLAQPNMVYVLDSNAVVVTVSGTF